ncbi:MAG: YfcE family phosphodiesterase [Sulfurimonas sp.]|nr:YfcE family phosphodiesterase [Sulfurimonas sp.]MDQ7060131.1 YfcE family phosphodiesterase [Sulfurimonas sp.]
MKIGIISDTHKKLKKAKKALTMLLENGAEFIVHAGDIVDAEVLELLKNCGKRYVAVYGNNDSHLLSLHKEYNLVEEPYYFKLANTKFKLMHLPYYMATDAEVVLSGHTHIFHSEFQNGTLFLNPGEVCARNKPVSGCAMLEVTNTTFIVTHYQRPKKAKYFTQEQFSYTRIKNV